MSRLILCPPGAPWAWTGRKEGHAMAKSKAQIAFERKEGYVEIRAENLSVRVDKNVKITSMTVRYLAVPKRSEKSVLFGSLDVTLNEILTLYGVRIVKAKVGEE